MKEYGSIKLFKTAFGRSFALLLILAFLAASAIGCAAQKQEQQAQTQVSPAPDKTEPAAATPAPSSTPEPEPEIYYGPVMATDYVIPHRGEIYDEHHVIDTARDDAYSGYLFAVTILYTPKDSLRNAIYATEPECAEFIAAFDEWRQTCTLTEEEQQAADDRNDAKLEELLLADFRQIWKEEHTEAKWEEFCSKEEKVRALLYDMSNFDLKMEYEHKVREAERKRLISLGIKPGVNADYRPYFLLTREQLENFADYANPGDGYVLQWARLYYIPEIDG